jgi:hypothetical protein
LYLLGVVALVAVIYSPSTIGIGAGNSFGTTSPSNTTDVGTSKFLTFLRSSGYHVLLVNDSQSEQSQITLKRAVLFLIGADVPLTSSELQTIQARYNAGALSLLVAEGNKTNEGLISTLFRADVSGAAIIDPTSAFRDKRVFTITVSLGPSPTAGVIDIASPIRFGSRALRPAANSSSLSVDTLDQKIGPRTVVGVGTSPGGARSLLITDSAPFANYLFDYTDKADERAFVGSLVDWTTRSNKSATILFDNFHYTSTPPKFSLNLPVGPIVAYLLELQLQGLDSYYSASSSNSPNILQSFGIPLSNSLLQVLLSIILLFAAYGAVTKWFAPEKKGKDDQPLPSIERQIVAESRARVDFLKTSRNKSFYVATIARLYEIIDEIVTKEFGTSVSSISPERLIQRLGTQKGGDAVKLFAELRKIYEHAQGKRRFIFPPVIRWKSRVSRLTRRAEQFLNEIGMTIAGEEESKKQVEYAIGRR